MARVKLNTSSEKMKVMSVKEENPIKIQVNNVHEDANETERYICLGSSISSRADAEQNILSRIGNAGSVFRGLRNIWQSNQMTQRSKIVLYNFLVIPVTSYNIETGKMTAGLFHRLNVFH